MNLHLSYHLSLKQWEAACKLWLIRLLLLGYMLMMVKPILPLLADHLAHKYWKSSHFQLVHKHDGNTHVHKEVSKIVDEGGKEKPATKIKYEVSDVCFVVNVLTLTLFTNWFLPPVYGYTSGYYSLLYQDVLYQPPRC